jgi:outer membrane protein
MNNRMRVGLVSLALICLPAAAQAQEGTSLSEEAAVRLAVANNPTLHVALLRAQQSRYNLSAEQALYTPLFDANAAYTRTRSPSLSGPADVVDDEGNVVRTLPATTRVGSSDVIDLGAGITKPFPFGTVLSASLGGQRYTRGADATLSASGSGPGYYLVGQVALSQPLLRGAGRDVGEASLRQARLSLTASQLAAQETGSALLSGVVSAYWELWYSSEVVRINQASLELARIQQAQADQQVASGALAPASALPYTTQAAQLEEAVLASRTDVRQRELALAQLLGDRSAAGASFAAADEPTPPSADEPAEARATSDALATSYARKQLQTQLALVKDQLKISGESLRPRLDLDAYVQAQGLGNRSVPPAFEQFGKMEAVSAHVGLTFETPITDTRRSSQVAAAQLSAHIAEKQLVENEVAIRSSVASTLARRRAARQRLELSTQTEKVAREQAEAERARFQAGSTIAISVQQAEDSHRQAQLRVQRARVDLVLADLELAELRGELLTRYAKSIQSLPAEQRVNLTSQPSNF